MEAAERAGVELVGAAHGPWEREGWQSVSVCRDSRELGENKSKPYLKDLLDVLAEKAEPGDWLFYCNCDCSIRSDLYQELLSLRATVVEYQRLDITGQPSNLDELFSFPGQPYSLGLDGLAIRAGFYRDFAHCLPDFIIGEPWWDPACSWILRQLIPVRRLSGRLFHPMHEQTWDVANAGPAGRHNYKLMKQSLELGHVSELKLCSEPDKTDTAVISCLFGDSDPHLRAVSQGLRRQSEQDLYCDHYLVELLDPGQESRLPSELLKRFVHLPVYGSERNGDLFQKEALFNLGWKRASRNGDYRYFIFTDGDIYSEDPSWFRQIRHRLVEDPRRAVQGYETVHDPQDPDFHYSSVGSVSLPSSPTGLPVNPGLCWGFYAKMLELGDGLNPYCIECAGDSALVLEYISQPGSVYEASLQEWPWYHEIHRDLPCRALLDAVPVDIVHVFHGPAKKRHYQEVRRTISKFKPLRSLVEIDHTGLLAWNDPRCAERAVLRAREELVSEQHADTLMAHYGIESSQRSVAELKISERPLPDWSSELPPVLRNRHVGTNGRVGQIERYSVFCPTRVFRENFAWSWCDQVEREHLNQIPLSSEKEQPRLVLHGLAESSYIIGVIALQPNWVPVDIHELTNLHLSLWAGENGSRAAVQLISQDEDGVEHHSQEVALDVAAQDRAFSFPLTSFPDYQGFDLRRVRTVKVVGYGSFRLEIYDVYFS